jgi:hypothetical protein
VEHGPVSGWQCRRQRDGVDTKVKPWHDGIFDGHRLPLPFRRNVAYIPQCWLARYGDKRCVE